MAALSLQLWGIAGPVGGGCPVTPEISFANSSPGGAGAGRWAHTWAPILIDWGPVGQFLQRMGSCTHYSGVT